MKLARVQIAIWIALLIALNRSFQILDEQSHEVLVDKPDRVKAMKESEIQEDEDHNVQDDSTTDPAAPDDFDIAFLSDDGLLQDLGMVSIDFGIDGLTSNVGVEVEIEEDFYDPETGTVTQKITKEGPGFQTVTIVTQSGPGPEIGGGLIFEELVEELLGVDQDAQGTPGEDAVITVQSGPAGQGLGMMGMFSQMAQMMGQMQQQQAMMMQDIIQGSMDQINKAQQVKPPRKNIFLNFDDEEEENEAEKGSQQEDTLEKVVESSNQQEKQAYQEKVQEQNEKPRAKNGQYESFEEDEVKEQKSADRKIFRSNLLWIGGLVILLIQAVSFALYCRSKAQEKRQKDNDLFAMKDDEPAEEIQVDAEYPAKKEVKKSKGKRD